MALMLGAIPLLRHFLDLSPKVEALFRLYLIFIALAMPAAMIQRALHAYASSLGRPKPIMWISWLALLLNIPLNYVFVYGKLGMPALGGAGCGLASMVVFWFNMLALWWYIQHNPEFKPWRLTSRFSLPQWQSLVAMTKLGIPIGFSFFLEVSLFTFIMLLIAKLDGNTEVALAAQQVVISITSIIYMIPQGIGTAATVRVGYSIGHRQYHRARYICGVSLSVGAAIALITAILLLLFRHQFVALYSDNQAILALSAQILLFAAAFQVADSLQCIASYALRGYKITKLPMLIHGVAFWVFGLGLGCLLAFNGMGILGFWTALVCSLALAAVALLWCLSVVSRRTILQRSA